jgi:5-methylcytosine-specific restriction protein A
MALKPTTRKTGREKQARREYDQRRGKTTDRGYGWDWQQFRAQLQQEHPLCHDCLDQGRVEPATDYHHIVKVRDDPTRKLDPTNIRPLCKRHHDVRTGKGE